MSTVHTADPATHATTERLRLEAQFRSSANWFFWIRGDVAGQLPRRTVRRSVGLRDRARHHAGDRRRADERRRCRRFAVARDPAHCRLAGVFIACGYFAREGRRSAFIAGISLCVLDSLIFVLVRDLLAVAFHAFALYCLIKGMRAKDQLDSLQGARMTPAGLASS